MTNDPGQDEPDVLVTAPPPMLGKRSFNQRTTGFAPNFIKLGLAGSLTLPLFGCPIPVRDTAFNPPSEYERHFLDSTRADDDPLGLGEYASPESRCVGSSDCSEETLVVLALSGGGHRSANLSAGALIGLEQLGLLDEVDYFSTVSGGGFAAASYVTFKLRNHPGTYASYLNRVAPRRALERNYKGSLGRAIGGCVVGGVLTAGVLGVALCWDVWFQNRDRDYGDRLEMRIDEYVFETPRKEQTEQRKKHRRCKGTPEACRPTTSSPTLGDLYAGKGETASIPYWIANAANWSNGARVPLTPEVIEQLGARHVPHNMEMLALEDGTEFPLSLALRASANFPAYPSTTLTDNGCGAEISNPARGKPRTCSNNKRPTIERYRHLQLVDGGIADNLGLVTAKDIIEHELSRPDSTTKRVLVVSVDAFNGSQSGWSREGRSGGPKMDVWWMSNAYMAAWRHHAYLDFLEFVEATPEVSWIPLGFETACEGRGEDCKWLPLKPREFKKTAGSTKLPPGLEGRNVRTDFNVTKKDQDVLLDLGEKLVRAHAKQIRSVVAGTSRVGNRSPPDIRGRAG